MKETIAVLWLLVWLAALATSIYGLVLCFSASIVLGIAALLIEPAPFVFGLLAFFGHPDAAQKLAQALGLGGQP